MTERTSKFNNGLATDYELFYHVFPYLLEMEGITAEYAALHFANDNPDAVIDILDIGSGTGCTTIALLKADSRFRVTAVEAEPKMIVQLAKNLAPYGDRVRIVESNILDYRSDLRFQAAISGCCYHNMNLEERMELFTWLGSTCPIGSLFVNFDKTAIDDETAHYRSFQKMMRMMEKFEEMDRPDLTRDWREHYILDNRPTYRFTEAEQRRLLQENGFGQIAMIHRHGMDAITVAVKQ